MQFFDDDMKHPSSISAKSIQGQDTLRTYTSSKSGNAQQDRFRYNQSEFREKLRHSAAQTETCIRIPSGTHQSVQVGEINESVSAIHRDLAQAQRELQEVRTRCSDREKILISQMNAVRDKDLADNERNVDKVTVTLRLMNCQFALENVPSDYETISVSAHAIEQESNESVIGLKRFKPMTLTRENPSIPLGDFAKMVIPRNTAQMYLLFTVRASCRSMYDMILGEFLCAPFFACMKELNKPECLQLSSHRGDRLEVELTFS